MAGRMPERGMKESSSMSAAPKGYVDMFKTSFELLKAPQETIRYKDKANLKDPIILLAIVGLISGVIGAVMNFIANMILGNAVGAFLNLIILPVLMLVVVPVGALIFEGITYLIAKLLGGKSTFTEHFYLTTLATITGLLISLLLVNIPCIGFIFLLGFIYLLYVLFVVVRDAHQTTTLNTAIALLIPVVLVIVAFVLLLATILVLLGLGAAGAAAGAYGAY